MIQKKKTPWGLLLLLLVMAEILAYYAGGLFKLDGVTLYNYQDKLMEILSHPFQSWFHEKTPAVMGTALILWLMAVSYFLIYYRDFHFDIEHGTAEWGNAEESGKRLQKQKKDPENVFNTYLSHNIAVSSEALSNMNVLVVGGSGSFKSTSVVTPNILEASCTNVILDIKGDLLKKHGKYLKKKGVTVKVFNLKNPLESDRYNPFKYVKDESDLIGLITNIQASVRPPDAMKGDPFWDDGVRLYLLSMFEYVYLKEQNDPSYKATMNDILELVNMESIIVDSETGTTLLQKKMEELAEEYGPDYMPVKYYRKLKEGAAETVRSIIIMVNAQLQLFDLPEIRRIFEDDDIDIPSLGLGAGGNPKKKTALFLVMRSRDTSYNLFINMFYTQMFRVLCDIADNDCKGGALPVHVRLWADEFYAGPKPAETEVLLGEIRSRNMSIVPILQDLAQIKTLFPNDKWEIFNGNCAAVIYLGSGPSAHSTHQWLSDMLNKATIDSRTEHIGLGSHGSSNLQNSRTGASLMTADQIRELPEDDCIILLEHEKPLYDKKNLPWKYRNEAWLESGKICGDGYVHPVRVVFNGVKREYRTIVYSSSIEYLSEEDFHFYEEASKKDPSILMANMDEMDFLYMNFKKPEPTEEDAVRAFQECMYQISDAVDEEGELPEDVIMMREEEKKKIVPKSGTELSEWNMSGTALECLLRYASELSAEETEEIIAGMEAGLTDKQIKMYFCLHDVVKMNQYRRAFQFSNSCRR